MTRSRRLLLSLKPDSYSMLALLLFLVTAAGEWRGYVRKHEAIYLLGSKRVADPAFLANDISWAHLPPTTFLFDHLLAPIWSVLDDPGIVALGRLVTWLMLAWALAALARNMRLPPWSVVAGFALWLLWDQTIAACGRPLEGFQPKQFAYPLAFWALAQVIGGRVVRAGIAGGLAIAFHVIIGGWSCVALAISMLLNRRAFSLRDVLRFSLAAAPFALPVVIATAVFHGGHISPDQQRVVNEIYVTFSQPHCVDPDYFLTPDVRARALVVFPVSVLLLLAWPEKRSGRIVAGFALALVGLFAAGAEAGRFHVYSFLKLYPFQLANSIPALMLFIMSLALCGELRSAGASRRLAWVLGMLVSAGLAIDGRVPERAADFPQKFADSLDWAEPGLYSAAVSDDRLQLYAWIRDNTPAEAIFATPYLPEFWNYTGRAQVASFRHPPLDRSLIEWKQRLESLNASQPFGARGFDIEAEFDRNERRLTSAQLLELSRRYGATHYLVAGRSDTLPWRRAYSIGSYSVYDLRNTTR